MALRIRNQVLLVKVESSEGVDASPGVTDAIKIDTVTVTPQPEIQDTTEATGAIDKGEFEIGKTPIEFAGTVKLKGSGAAGTAPEVDPLLRACGWAATTLAATVPTTSTTTASAGTTTSFTVDRTAGNGADWSNTTGTYIGYVVTLTTNPTAATTCQIKNYVVTGSNAVVTLDRVFSPALDVTTTASIPLQVIYKPTSGTVPSVSAYCYYDGLVDKIFGARGDVTLKLLNGAKADLEFKFAGVIGADEADAAVPTGTFDSTAAPKWRLQDGGSFRVDNVAAGIKDLSVSFNNQLPFPPNPNATDGIDPPTITGRDLQGTATPQTTLVATRAMFLKFRNGTKMAWTAQLGSVAGNRIFILIPQAKLRNITRTSEQDLMLDTLPFSAISSNDGCILTFA